MCMLVEGVESNQSLRLGSVDARKNRLNGKSVDPSIPGWISGCSFVKVDECKAVCPLMEESEEGQDEISMSDDDDVHRLRRNSLVRNMHKFL